MHTYELLSQLVTIRLNGGTQEDLKEFFDGLTEAELDSLSTFGFNLANVCRGQKESRKMLNDILEISDGGL